MNKVIALLTVLVAVNSFAAAKKTTKAVKGATPVAAAQPSVNPQPQMPAAKPAGSEVAGSSSAAVTTAAPASQAAITGTIDLRPSWGTKAGEVHTENWADLGYKMGNLHLIYEQDFNTNLYSPGAATTGLDFTLQHGFLRAKVDNIWMSDDKNYSLSYEFRPFLPTQKLARDAGMITVVRNYAKFAAKLSDAVTLSLWEVPMVYAYSRAGNTVDGVSTGNPIFENRVYAMVDWNITEKWSLNFPLILNQVRSREYNGVAAGWTHVLWTYPELDYALNSNYTLGLSWYNDNFIKPDFSDVQLSEGFQSGVTQLVFRATL